MKHSWKTLKFVSSEDEEIIHTEDKNKGLTLFTSSDGKKKKKLQKRQSDTLLMKQCLLKKKFLSHT